VRYLILSDIHANRAALDAVMSAANGLYDTVICCGDFVGYGPDPNYVTDFCRAEVRENIRGNHDKAAVGLADLEWFNPVARGSAVWTASVLTPQNREWITGQRSGPLGIDDDFIIVHGSPRDEDEYVIASYEAREAARSSPAAVSFFGHTHLQGGFQVHRNNGVRELKPSLGEVVVDDTSTWLINPGSVGQPRDGDPRAAWAIFDSEHRVVNWHRTEYDIRDTYRRIVEAGLPEVLGLRLHRGI